MESIKILPNLIPILPITSAIILPNAILPVSVSEYEYNHIIMPAIKDYDFLGVVQSKDGDQNKIGPYKDSASFYKTGCLVKLEDAKEADDDKVFVLFSGVSRFNITNEVESDYKYRLAFVNYEKFFSDLFKEESVDSKVLLKTLEGYLKNFDIGINVKDFKDSTVSKLITAISMLCPLSSNEKQALIEAASTNDQIEIMKTLIECAKYDMSTYRSTH